MVDYNDGQWHGWNGGECPVHPNTEVEAVCESMVQSGFGRAGKKIAHSLDWRSGIGSQIIAFRVVKEYREPPEPRQVYVAFTTNGIVADVAANKDSLHGYNYHEIKKFREVIE